MKGITGNLNKAFENRVRIGIMTVLTDYNTIEFNSMKELLEVTDGNLASHISALENGGFVSISKRFIGKKTNTSFSATLEGTTAFKTHLRNLEVLIKRCQ